MNNSSFILSGDWVQKLIVSVYLCQMSVFSTGFSSLQQLNDLQKAMPCSTHSMQWQHAVHTFFLSSQTKWGSPFTRNIILDKAPYLKWSQLWHWFYKYCIISLVTICVSLPEQTLHNTVSGLCVCVCASVCVRESGGDRGEC